MFVVTQGGGGEEQGGEATQKADMRTPAIAGVEHGMM